MALAWALVAAVLLASGPAEAARKAFLSDLEASSSNAASSRTGRRLQQSEIPEGADVEILDSADYDVIEVLSAAYDPMIGAYGGYGVYGYYGNFYGVYGSYAGDFFVDYMAELTDEEIFAELDNGAMQSAGGSLPGGRRLLQHGHEQGGEHYMGDGHNHVGEEVPVEDVELLDWPFEVTDYGAAFDFHDTERGPGYGFYSGFAYGSYSGMTAVYGGYYGGEWWLDAEGVWQHMEEVGTAAWLLDDAVQAAAEEDLAANMANGEGDVHL
ncbi:hypothetical protein HYH02_005312 [Chlamydomonas schloesseri]|uniref:Uncharacterized protein n=1 Tax=Chlamydomonas schloesseri TaxID=2026947 RepID=A0A835WL91_9CHLO|nr:hypothetical protein HYH02_005312 [Chlamydomonas schloesseri]|eukprot:KAG2449788.1 hypothetical protein HYH02_005312 [Chlamydomonas schloesseri]